MSDDYISLTEFLASLTIFVGPFVGAAGVAPFLILRRAQVHPGIAVLVVSISEQS